MVPTERVETGRARIAEQRAETFSKGLRRDASRGGPELHDELIWNEAALDVGLELRDELTSAGAALDLGPALDGAGRRNTQPRQKNGGENESGKESQKR